MHESQSCKRQLKFKSKMSKLNLQMMKLKLILQMGALHGIFFIKAQLKKIDLAK
jgi:hypothetical protein